jgi:hypothetical protein
MARGIVPYVADRIRSTVKCPNRTDRQADIAQHLLRVAAIVLQAIAVRTAADDMESLAPELVLEVPTLLGDVLEQNDAVTADVTYPSQLALPIIDAVHHSGQSAMAKWVCDVDPDVVPLGQQPQI